MICTRMDWWLRKENDQVNLMPIMAGRYVLSSIMNSIIKDAFAEGKYVKNRYEIFRNYILVINYI